MVMIIVHRLVCNQCGHTWIPRKELVFKCPRCQSCKWDMPKEEKKGKTLMEVFAEEENKNNEKV